MKKIVLVFISLLLLSACGQNKQKQQDSPKQTIADVDYQRKVEEKVIEEVEDDGKIDIDLSQFSSIAAYSEVCNLISDLEGNEGKRIKIRGMLEYYEDPDTKKKTFGCTLADATACCSLGLMFVPVDDTNLPEKYSMVNVTGIFEVYEEDGYELCRLKNAVVEW